MIAPLLVSYASQVECAPAALSSCCRACCGLSAQHTTKTDKAGNQASKSAPSLAASVAVRLSLRQHAPRGLCKACCGLNDCIDPSLRTSKEELSRAKAHNSVWPTQVTLSLKNARSDSTCAALLCCCVWHCCSMRAAGA
jgi:hypothetical protein